MIYTISEIDNLIASLSETLTDVEMKELRVTFIKILIKHQISMNSKKGLGIAFNDVYFPAGMRYDFDDDEHSIAVLYDVKCVGVINYTDIRSWS